MIRAINISLLVCQGTCLVRPHSASQSFIPIAWRACGGGAARAACHDLFSGEIQGGREHFFPVDAVALGSNNHMLAVAGPEFSCALLQVNALGWRYRVIFLPFFFFFPRSIWVFLQSKWYFSHEALRVTHPLRLWHSPWPRAGGRGAASRSQTGFVSG